MPIQQPTQTFTPNEAAQMVGTAAHNVRRWTEYHAAHLSPLATPPPGQPRRYNGRDVEVLKHVKALRMQGLTVPVINEQLAGLTFAEVDTDEQTVTNSEELATQNAPERLRQEAVAIMVVEAVNAIEDRIQARLESRLVAIETSNQEAKQNRRDGVSWFAIGFLVAGFLFLGMVLLSWLYGG